MLKPLVTRCARAGWQGHLIALLAGSLITLSLAPFYFWPGAILALFFYALGLESISPRSAFVRGWWFGNGLYCTGASWIYVSIHVHGNTAAPLAIIFTAIFCCGLALLSALVSYLYVRFLRDLKLGLLLALPSLWLLGEWLRCWLLTGFPWLFIGYSQVEAPLAGWAPVIGTLGISWILALTGCALAALLLAQRGARVALVAALLLWVTGLALSRVDWVDEVPGATLRVSAIQMNIPQELKWEPEFLKPTLELYRRKTQDQWDSDLIVWPETAVPRIYQRAQYFLSYMDSQAKRHHSAIITGIPYRSPDEDKVYNSIIAIGEGEGIYHKKRLVPFGEYLPLDHYLRGIINFFNIPMSNFMRGPDQQVYLEVKGLKLAPFICYEVVYPDLVAGYLPNADILITISNDTWFGHSHGPVQHMQMAQMRALETGRYLIRGTNNGITAFVDPKGHIYARAERFTRTTLTAEVKAMQGLTPFARTGLLPGVIISAVLVVLSLVVGRRDRHS